LTISPAAADDDALVLRLAKKCLEADGGLPFLLNEEFRAALFPMDSTVIVRDPTQQVVAIVAKNASDDQGSSFALLTLPTANAGQILDSLMTCSLLTDAPRPWTFRCESAGVRLKNAFADRGGEHFFGERILSSSTESAEAVSFDFTAHAWTAESAPLFFDAYYQSFAERPGFPNPTREQWISDQSDDEGFRPEASRVLVDDAGQAVGYVLLDDEQIWQIGVTPPYRRRGLARQLLAHALHSARENDQEFIWLCVNLNNEAAQNLYESMGFEVFGERARIRLA
jgi:ribosomal protein S18 acetylase RimI-like enzyme